MVEIDRPSAVAPHRSHFFVASHEEILVCWR